MQNYSRPNKKCCWTNCLYPTLFHSHMGVSENSVPHFPQWFCWSLSRLSLLNGYFIGNIYIYIYIYIGNIYIYFHWEYIYIYIPNIFRSKPMFVGQSPWGRPRPCASAWRPNLGTLGLWPCLAEAIIEWDRNGIFYKYIYGYVWKWGIPPIIAI